MLSGSEGLITTQDHQDHQVTKNLNRLVMLLPLYNKPCIEALLSILISVDARF